MKKEKIFLKESNFKITGFLWLVLLLFTCLILDNILHNRKMNINKKYIKNIVIIFLIITLICVTYKFSLLLFELETIEKLKSNKGEIIDSKKSYIKKRRNYFR